MPKITFQLSPEIDSKEDRTALSCRLGSESDSSLFGLASGRRAMEYLSAAMHCRQNNAELAKAVWKLESLLCCCIVEVLKGEIV